MKTSDLLKTMNNQDQSLEFRLPGGVKIHGDLHITEVKNITIDSTDCGGFSHSFQETVIQLWLNEDSDKIANWTTEKAREIFNIVGNQRAYLNDAPAFFEFGDSQHITSKYGIKLNQEGDTVVLDLVNQYPECKPKTSATKTSATKSCCC